MNERLPDRADWGAIPADDLDVQGAFEDFFGKSNSELAAQYRAYPIAMADSLRWMPSIPFAYYVMGFAAFVLSREFTDVDAPDIASSFLNLIRDRASRWPAKASVAAGVVLSAVEHLATHQSEYHADPDIYGSFADRGDEIAQTFKTHGLLT